MLPTAPERKLWNDGPNYTADAVIVDPRKQKILLIQRGDCGEWALPGGFVDPSDASALVAAKREAAEEAHIALDNQASLLYQGIVDDPRNSEDAWIETSAYLFGANSEQITSAGDDAIDAKWFSLDTLPELYASHRQIVERALDLQMSCQAHEEFLQTDGDHYIRNVDGGHMGYDKILHTNTESAVSVFQKSSNLRLAVDTEYLSRTRAYLKKEALVMSHLRTHGYRHLPHYSHLVLESSLFMEGFPPEKGWQWRAPIDATDRYIRDCLQAFDDLEKQPIAPDTDDVQPSLDTFAGEGWPNITREKETELRDIAALLSPHFQADTRESLYDLLDNVNALRQASMQIQPVERYVFSHHDARQSNIAWHPDHGARIVDWSWAGYGRPGSDTTNFLIDMHKSGHDISAYLDRINPEHCLTLIGFWLEHATWPARDDATIRRQQLLSAVSAYEALLNLNRG